MRPSQSLRCRHIVYSNSPVKSAASYMFGGICIMPDNLCCSLYFNDGTWRHEQDENKHSGHKFLHTCLFFPPYFYTLYA